MRTAILCTISVFLLGSSLFSCRKKAKEEPAKVTTDSLYLYAIVDSLVFTASSTEGTYSGQSSYWISTKAYLEVVARTGGDSNDKAISLRIDNFPNQPGEYIISAEGGGKASYRKNSKDIEVADSGRITITEIGKSVKGRFYFYTEHHKITEGFFAAQ